MPGSLPLRAQAIPWYRRDDYPAVLRIMVDGHVLPPTWQAWRKKADQTAENYVKQGITVVRVYIDPETFPDWCRANGLDVDAGARKFFAAREAALKHGQTH